MGGLNDPSAALPRCCGTSRATHKIAISDRRIVDVDEETVSLTYKDYRHGNEQKIMRLHSNEWLRRFTTHVLPRGFVRLRSFGFLANAGKAEKLEGIRALLGAPAPAKPPAEPERRACACPVCGCGALVERRALGPVSRDTS